MGTGTGIARVRGLGSARSGVSHWWLQRVTSASNMALILWFLISLARLPDIERDTVSSWLQSPLNSVPLILLVMSTFYHFRLGLQVVIEDYVQGEGNKVAWTLGLNFYAIGMAALAIFSILRVAFGGDA